MVRLRRCSVLLMHSACAIPRFNVLMAISRVVATAQRCNIYTHTKVSRLLPWLLPHGGMILSDSVVLGAVTFHERLTVIVNEFH